MSFLSTIVKGFLTPKALHSANQSICDFLKTVQIPENTLLILVPIGYKKNKTTLVPAFLDYEAAMRVLGEDSRPFVVNGKEYKTVDLLNLALSLITNSELEETNNDTD